MLDIQLYSKLIDLDPFKAVEKMGESLAKSGCYGCERKEQGEVLAMICLTTGRTPEQIKDKYHIINGNLSRKAGSALAEFKKIGGKYKWTRTGQEPDLPDEDRYAECWFSIDGQEMTVRFSVKDALRAGLVRSGSTWQKMPWKMLRARVISDALGMLAPEIYFGDDADEAPQQEPKAIKLDAGEAPPMTEAAKPVKVKESKDEPIEAEIVREEPKPSQKPKSQSEPEPKKAQTAAPPPPPASGILPDETVDQLQQAIGADAKIAMAYFYKKGWLKPGQNLEHLPPGRANQVLEKTQPLLAYARKIAKEDAEAKEAA